MNERAGEVEAFFHKHNCMAALVPVMDKVRGCSNFTLPNPLFPLTDGCVGMPMPATVLAVFDPETLEEKSYGEIGEVCMNSNLPKCCTMAAFPPKLTERTLVMHPDGERWLHTGDMGYISENGIVYILGRGDVEALWWWNTVYDAHGEPYGRSSRRKDGFFCFVPDAEHEGYSVPYLFRHSGRG